MSGFSQWMKEIIMVTMLATFIDLLLPNRSLQRYVQLMLRLILLLILLSPVLKLFHIHIADEWMKQWHSSWHKSTSTVKRTTLKNIQAQSDHLITGYTADALQLTELELGKQMKTQLLQMLAKFNVENSKNNMTSAPEVKMKHLQVKLQYNGKQQPMMERLEVTLLFVDSNIDKQTKEKNIYIQPIEQVQIHIRPFTTHKQTKRNFQEKDVDQQQLKYQLLRNHVTKEVTRLFTTLWVIRTEQISIAWLSSSLRSSSKK